MSQPINAPPSSPGTPPVAIGDQIVIDVAAPYVYLGRLTAVEAGWLVLEDADAHDLRDSSTTRELYILDSRRHGIGVNRRRVCVRLDQVVGVSRLHDVIT